MIKTYEGFFSNLFLNQSDSQKDIDKIEKFLRSPVSDIQEMLYNISDDIDIVDGANGFKFAVGAQRKIGYGVYIKLKIKNDRFITDKGNPFIVSELFGGDVFVIKSFYFSTMFKSSAGYGIFGKLDKEKLNIVHETADTITSAYEFESFRVLNHRGTYEIKFLIN